MYALNIDSHIHSLVLRHVIKRSGDIVSASDPYLLCGRFKSITDRTDCVCEERSLLDVAKYFSLLPGRWHCEAAWERLSISISESVRHLSAVLKFKCLTTVILCIEVVGSGDHG